jgi:hypothetical protein
VSNNIEEIVAAPGLENRSNNIIILIIDPHWLYGETQYINRKRIFTKWSIIIIIIIIIERGICYCFGALPWGETEIGNL